MTSQRGVSYKFPVSVGEQICEVYVTRRAKTVWVASGQYAGHSIETKGSSQSSAVAHWQKAARLKERWVATEETSN